MLPKDKNTEPQKGEKAKTVAGGRTCMGVCAVVLLVTSCLCIAAIFLIPSPINPQSFTLSESLPTFEGPLEPNGILRKTEKLYEGQITGPESIAVDHSGTVFSGLADGRIVKFVDGKVVEVARTGKLPCGTFELEPTCGRPLGMRFDRYGVHLYVADAYYGILKVDTISGTVSTVVPPQHAGVDGEPLKLINDLDIGRDGTIYFTDSSAKWERRYHSLSIIEGDATGRLLAYHKTGELEVLASGLRFANGVQISPHGDFVLVAELTMARILKYHLKGKDEGKLEVFMENLPGFPDNIRLSSNDGYWIGMAAVRKAPFSMLDWMAPRPFVRNLMAKFIPQEWVKSFVPKYGLIVEVSGSGRIIRSFHDPEGQVISSVSEVHEENGVLYLGSYISPFLGKLELSK